MKRVTSPIRWWDFPAASLLLVGLITAATRLVATGWTEHLGIVQIITFFGVLAGFGLGQSRFSARSALLIGLGYGLFIVPWMLGRTMGPGILWTERLISLVGRLSIIINQLVTKEPVQDSLLFLVLMAALFWLVSAHAGYTLVRHGNAWRAILPAGLALFVIHTFDAIVTRRAWYLAVYLFFGLVLVARVAYLHRHNQWQQSRTALPPHLGLDFIRFTLLVTGVIVLFAWTAPALANTLPVAERAWRPVRQTWNEVRDRWDSAFASLTSSVGVVSDFYGTSVILGRGNRLSDSHVFRVRPPFQAPDILRYYWRARTYDTFDGNQWHSTASLSQGFKPEDDRLNLPREDGRWIGTFEFTSYTYISTLFAPSQPLWVSRPAQVELANNPDLTADPSAFRATPALRPGDVYQASASLSNVTITELRQAGINYPEWVTERYLQLPSSISSRTLELADQIADGLDNPYDISVAVTNYLRNNITYTEVVPAKPNNQDSIDWFLFDLQEGFCNYYASAEVVLLRALGIPARWVVGYAEGERLEGGDYLVRQRDAHAWPEVYFPGYGWVEFEPTSSQPVITRLLGDPSDTESQASALNNERERREREEMEEELRLLRERQREALTAAAAPANLWTTALYWSSSLIVAGLLLTLAWRARTRYNLFTVPIVMETTLVKMGFRPPAILSQWARRAALPPLARAYHEINSALSRLGSRAAATDTPAERAAALSRLIPPAEIPAQRLVDEYQVETFSPQPADLSTAREAGNVIRTLSYKAWLKRLLSRFQRPERSERTWSYRQHK